MTTPTSAPSALRQRITDDMKDAMRARQSDRLGTIRLLLAALKQKEIDERIELDDTMVVSIVDKLIKQRKESIGQFSAAGRTDLVDKETAELAVLQAYLPARLDADQIDAEVGAILATLAAELGRPVAAADIGKAMAAAKAKLAGAADMGAVSAAVKRALAK